MKTKCVSRAEAEVKRLRTIQFLDCIDRHVVAARFEGMSVEEYARHKGLTLRNPILNRRMNIMAGKSKADLQDEIDEQESYIEELESKLDEIAELAADTDDQDDEEEDLDLSADEED